VLTRSCCIVIPPNTPHVYAASDTDPWTIWWLHARGAGVAELVGPALGTPRPMTRLKSLDRVIALFDEIVVLLERRLSPASLLAASGLAWQLLTRIATDSVLSTDGSALERAMRYLEDRVDGTISVSELASLVGVSASHLSSLFRQATGGGPAAFHASLKMARARVLLDTTEIGIAEVAAAVGYADPLYFSRHFRKLHGLSPSAYRAHRKG
jgi:AraC-like DNA-binding protein